MTPTELAGVRALAEALPPGTPLPLPRELVLALLEGSVVELGLLERPPVDVTVAEAAVRFERRPATVRAWCEAGRFPGAYKLRGREWRIPPAAMTAFQEAERSRASGAPRSRTGRTVNLASWRVVS